MISFFTPERISILLETLSFFLVTTDLFGNKRLERVKERILASRPNIEFDDDRLERTFSIIQISCFVLVALRLGIDIYGRFDEYKAIVASRFGNTSNNEKYGEWIVLLILFVVVGFLVALVGFALSIPAAFLFFILFFGRYALLILIKKLLKITSLEGVLLLTGTIIFIFSRVLSFIYSK